MSLGKSKSTLKKIESLYQELNYRIRYERGNFQSGYCVVNDSRMIVVNKFFDVKGRINILVEILAQLDYEASELSEEAESTLQKILKLDIFTQSQVA